MSEISGADVSAYLLIAAGVIWMLVGIFGLKAKGK
jgi:hypothetical protein